MRSIRSSTRCYVLLASARRAGVIALVLTFVGNAGCRESGSEESSSTRSVEDRFVVVPLSAPPRNSGSEIELTGVWAHGGPSNPEEAQFGRIVDAAFGEESTVFILDAATHRIRQIESGGKIVQVFGRAGYAPGETLDPRALIYDSIVGAVWVADYMNGIVGYSIKDKGGFTPLATIPLDFRPTDICMWKDDFIVYGLHAGSTMHLIDRSGSILMSFGDPFGPDHPVNGIVSLEGRLACFPEHDIVATIPRLLPELRSYRVSSGELVWSASPPHFSQVVIQLEPPGFSAGSYTMSEPPGGADQNVVLSRISDQLLLLQSRRAPEDQPVEAISTCVIEIMTGACVIFRHDLPLIPAVALGYSLAISGGSSPYPEVKLAKLVGLPVSGSNASIHK